MSKKTFAFILLAICLVFLIFKGLSRFKAEEFSGRSFRNASHLILTRHAKCRMDCRQITIDEIKEIIENGVLNKSKSGIGSKGDSTFALEGYSRGNEHLRVVVAPETDGLVVITCIDLKREWPCNCN